MPSKVYKFARWIGIALCLCFLGAATLTWFKHQQEIDATPDQQKIARSLEIIRTSSVSNRKVLKVLFYGQSITRSGWHKAVVAHWQELYPNTVFVVENRALGGFASQLLVRTTEQDIAAFYPDLIVFHVYGDHRAYEQILRMFRSLTAADVILQTDHGDGMPEAPCAEGLALSLRSPPGCAGSLWVHQRLWHDEMSYHKILAFGKKYGMAVEPQRLWWRNFLLESHVEPGTLLLSDGLHPNAKGNELIAKFFNQYFDALVERWNGEVETHIHSVAASESTNQSATLEFDGSRLEVLSYQPLKAWPSVSIDGHLPTDLDGCYRVTRTTPLESVVDWPSLRRVTLLHDHTAEDWTATVTSISPDQHRIAFSVASSTGGDEGQGDSSRNFLAKSGKLSIEGEDWMFAWAFDFRHIPLRIPTEVRWSVQDICGGTPEVIDMGAGLTQYRYVLGAGLINGKHTAKLSFTPNDLAGVAEFRVYKPAL